MWLDLAAAASYLGYSKSGLRKVLKRGKLRKFQASKRAQIQFRKEWLDEFVASNPDESTEAAPPPTTRSKQPKRTKNAPPVDSGAVSEFGFSSALLKL